MVEKLLLEKSKQGIAMIELIFALVIMGIGLMSAPMLIQQSIKSGNVALQQEAIAAAASHTSMLLSLHWDESNSKFNAGTSPILVTDTEVLPEIQPYLENNLPNTDFGGFYFDPTKPASVGIYAIWKNTQRAGLVGVTGRSITDANFSILKPAPIASLDDDPAETTRDDIDDYNGKTVGLVVYTPAGGTPQNAEAELGDYVDVNLKIKTKVNYANNNFTINTAQSTNIKFINVNLTSPLSIDELNKSITMKAFSCNIGTTAPQDRGEL